jgi:hypothetical protein
MTMTKPVEDNLDEAIERLTKLGAAGLYGIGLKRVIMHCAAAPSCQPMVVAIFLTLSSAGGGNSSRSIFDR